MARAARRCRASDQRRDHAGQQQDGRRHADGADRNAAARVARACSGGGPRCSRRCSAVGCVSDAGRAVSGAVGGACFGGDRDLVERRGGRWQARRLVPRRAVPQRWQAFRSVGRATVRPDRRSRRPPGSGFGACGGSAATGWRGGSAPVRSGRRPPPPRWPARQRGGRRWHDQRRHLGMAAAGARSTGSARNAPSAPRYRSRRH